MRCILLLIITCTTTATYVLGNLENVYDSNRLIITKRGVHAETTHRGHVVIRSSRLIRRGFSQQGSPRSVNSASTQWFSASEGVPSPGQSPRSSHSENTEQVSGLGGSPRPKESDHSDATSVSKSPGSPQLSGSLGSPSSPKPFVLPSHPDSPNPFDSHNTLDSSRSPSFSRSPNLQSPPPQSSASGQKPETRPNQTRPSLSTGPRLTNNLLPPTSRYRLSTNAFLQSAPVNRGIWPSSAMWTTNRIPGRIDDVFRARPQTNIHRHEGKLARLTAQATFEKLRSDRIAKATRAQLYANPPSARLKTPSSDQSSEHGPSNPSLSIRIPQNSHELASSPGSSPNSRRAALSGSPSDPVQPRRIVNPSNDGNEALNKSQRSSPTSVFKAVDQKPQSDTSTTNTKPSSMISTPQQGSERLQSTGSTGFPTDPHVQSTVDQASMRPHSATGATTLKQSPNIPVSESPAERSQSAPLTGNVMQPAGSANPQSKEVFHSKLRADAAPFISNQPSTTRAGNAQTKKESKLRANAPAWVPPTRQSVNKLQRRSAGTSTNIGVGILGSKRSASTIVDTLHSPVIDSETMNLQKRSPTKDHSSASGSPAKSPIGTPKIQNSRLKPNLSSSSSPLSSTPRLSPSLPAQSFQSFASLVPMKFSRRKASGEGEVSGQHNVFNSRRSPRNAISAPPGGGIERPAAISHGTSQPRSPIPAAPAHSLSTVIRSPNRVPDIDDKVSADSAHVVPTNNVARSPMRPDVNAGTSQQRIPLAQRASIDMAHVDPSLRSPSALRLGQISARLLAQPSTALSGNRINPSGSGGSPQGVSPSTSGSLSGSDSESDVVSATASS